MTLPRRKLGRYGPAVSAIGLGCMGMSEFYGPTDEAQSLDALARAVELGIDFIDTADIYGSGHNETLVGRFVRSRSEPLAVATKFGIVRAEPGKYERRIDNSPTYVKAACDASLKRLGLDHVALYYAHRFDGSTPVEDMMGALSDLIRAGKIGHIGLSEVTAETLRRAHAVHPVAAVQSEYSLWSREPENGLLAACRALGVAFVPYSPLGRGFLTGRFDAGFGPGDFRAMNPRFAGENGERNRRALADFVTMAEEKGATPAQLALAWVLAQGDDLIPIPGTKRRAYVEENVGAAAVTLTPEDLARIETILPRGFAAGDRYTAEGFKGINV